MSTGKNQGPANGDGDDRYQLIRYLGFPKHHTKKDHGQDQYPRLPGVDCANTGVVGKVSDAIKTAFGAGVKNQ